MKSITATHALTGEPIEHVLGTVPDVPLVYAVKPTSNRVLARVQDDLVVELINEVHDVNDEWHPIIVKMLVDVTKLKPQPEVGWVRAADGSFAPPPPYVPTARERMDAAMAAGFSLSSTATPSLNATYDVAGQRWQQMLGEAPYITAFGSFSGGVTKLDWPARSGEVVFATTAEFLAVVRALADQLTLWQRFVDGKGEEPASEVTVP